MGYTSMEYNDVHTYYLLVMRGLMLGKLVSMMGGRTNERDSHLNDGLMDYGWWLVVGG